LFPARLTHIAGLHYLLVVFSDRKAEKTTNKRRKYHKEQPMRLTEDKVRRIAENLHDGLEQQGLLAYKDARGSKPGTARALRIKEIYDFIVSDLRKEEEIDAEVERILDTYSRGLKGTERDVLFRKHKEEVARKRGYTI